MDKYRHKRKNSGVRSCYNRDGSRKIKYQKEMGTLVANRLNSKKGSDGNTHCYECDKCGHHHVGHRRIDNELSELPQHTEDDKSS